MVTFFSGSHYWGGQLKDETKHPKVMRELKKNCESRWHALILLCWTALIRNHDHPDPV
jgi:hypothetical protein